MRPGFDGSIVALIILVVVAIAFLASTPWINLAFLGAAVLAAAGAALLGKAVCTALARRPARRERRDAQ